MSFIDVSKKEGEEEVPNNTIKKEHNTTVFEIQIPVTAALLDA